MVLDEGKEQNKNKTNGLYDVLVLDEGKAKTKQMVCMMCGVR